MGDDVAVAKISDRLLTSVRYWSLCLSRYVAQLMFQTTPNRLI